ncbi:MAG: hypothetical protein M8840_08435 [marine benthic group bacterium]|nr:hypothetical protein [Gemmatimonadota bacterium]
MIGTRIVVPGRKGSGHALVPLLLVMLAASAAALPAQEIRGAVYSAADSTAVSGAVVLLHRITSVSGEVVDSTTADASGRFRLTIEEAENPEILYAAASVRGGVSYFGPILHAGMEAPDPYAIYVHEVESIEAPVTNNPVLLRHVVVSPTAHGLLQVGEIVDVAGTPGRALRTTDASIPIWSMLLPRGYQSWAPIEGGNAPESITESDGRVEARATLPPNGMRLSYGYFIEGTELDFPIEYPTERFELILVGVGEDGLRGLRPGELGELPPGSEARRFVASDLEPGESVGLTIESEPVAWGPVLIAGLIGVALLGAAAISYRLARPPST